ncbi:hypothetical protein ACWFMI_25005 [Nocardiopsis terrae]|uniref:hypothetical protein n=1 Tax=Streptomyces sp. NPDC057554 TaxID=3350538 RepID=UPI0036CC1622
MAGALIIGGLILTALVVTLAAWGHNATRAGDRGQLRDARNRDTERRAALHLLATIRDRASTAEQAGLPLAPGEITHLIDRFHTNPR